MIRAKAPIKSGQGVFDGPAQREDRLPAEFGREHLPRALDEVVGLVDQEGIRSRLFQEEAPQIRLGVEGVVVVADHRIRPQRQVQGKFERADPEAARRRGNSLPRPGILLEHGAAGLREAVEMAPGIVTLLGVAGPVWREADLLLGGQRQAFQTQSAGAQLLQGLFGRQPAGGAGREIKNLGAAAIGDGFDRREKHRHGLADAGGGLDEYASCHPDGAIDRLRHIFLARSEGGVWKGQIAQGGVAFSAPLGDDGGPFKIARHQFVEERREFGEREPAPNRAGGAGVEPCVGELDLDIADASVDAVQKGIGLGLAPVQRVVAAKAFLQAAAGGLDLLDHRGPGAGKHAVDPASNFKHEIFGLDSARHGDLRHVFVRSGILDPLVDADGLRGARGAGKLHHQVSASQHMLHQFAHADCQLCLHGWVTTISKIIICDLQ